MERDLYKYKSQESFSMLEKRISYKLPEREKRDKILSYVFLSRIRVISDLLTQPWKVQDSGVMPSKSEGK